MDATAAGPVLRDIHLPPPPSWWPPAPGWWIAGLVVLVVLGLTGRFAWRRWRDWRWRCRIRAELDRIAASHAAQADPARTAADVSRLLRRAALLIDRRAATLTGEAWLEFLDRHGDGSGFREGPGRHLLAAPYRRQPELDAASLIELARRWFARALPRRRHDV
ncbi:MAG: DUF4381 domain-containing protein [Lysobacterales bacterium]